MERQDMLKIVKYLRDYAINYASRQDYEEVVDLILKVREDLGDFETHEIVSLVPKS